MAYEENIEQIAPTYTTKKEGILTKSPDVEIESPRVERSSVTMSAPWASGSHGGHLEVLGYKEYLAGERIRNIQIRANIKMQPLVHPNFSSLKFSVQAVFIPHKRVWHGYNDLIAQAPTPFKTRRGRLPSCGLLPASRAFAQFRHYDRRFSVPLMHSTIWRDTIAYSYYGTTTGVVNRLLYRGYVAAFNDIYRDRRSQPPLEEFNGDEPTTNWMNMVSDREARFINGINNPTFLADDITGAHAVFFDEDVFPANRPIYRQRVPARSTYWNSHRITRLGSVSLEGTGMNTDGLRVMSVVNSLDEMRQLAGNVNLTDEEIIAKIRGVNLDTSGQCRVISSREYEIDMSLGNNNPHDAIQLGQEGAISFSNVELDLPVDFRDNNDGFIHYFYTITMPDNALYTTTGNFEAFKVDWEDIYRPGLSTRKDHRLTVGEIDDSRSENSVGGISETVGWNRQWSHYFRHPVLIRGDFGRPNTFSTGWKAPSINREEVISLPSYDAWAGFRHNSEVPNFNQFTLDFTDIAIRKLMFANQIDTVNNPFTERQHRLYLRSSVNHFALVGRITVETTLPIENDIRDDRSDGGVTV